MLITEYDNVLIINGCDTSIVKNPFKSSAKVRVLVVKFCFSLKKGGESELYFGER
jgi:hypothetical protein